MARMECVLGLNIKDYKTKKAAVLRAAFLACIRRLLSVFNTWKRALNRAIVNLARATDIFVFAAEFFPLRNPTGQSSECKQYGKHRGWET